MAASLSSVPRVELPVKTLTAAALSSLRRASEKHAKLMVPPEYAAEAEILRRLLTVEQSSLKNYGKSVKNAHWSFELGNLVGREPGDPVMLLNVARLEDQYRRWENALPMVRPFYAVKCNSERILLAKLASLGVGFDCASEREILAVSNLHDRNGTKVDVQRDVIFSNPCKPDAAVQFARKMGVDLTVVDNADELRKIAEINSSAKLLLRIKTDDASAQCPLSCKFGVAVEDCPPLVALAKQLGLALVGVHFHVGSGCSKAGVFAAAISDARKVFHIMRSSDFLPNVLNIGGGFPGTLVATGNVSFEDLAVEIRTWLDRKFSDVPNLQVMAEPGRFFAAPSCTLAVQIYARRATFDSAVYYVNDGVYGCFNNLIFDHAKVHPRLLSLDNHSTAGNGSSDRDVNFLDSSIFGPTCDGIDLIAENIELPLLPIKSFLLFEEMGAYTLCAATDFNGIRRTQVVPVRAMDQQFPFEEPSREFARLQRFRGLEMQNNGMSRHGGERIIPPFAPISRAEPAHLPPWKAAASVPANGPVANSDSASPTTGEDAVEASLLPSPPLVGRPVIRGPRVGRPGFAPSAARAPVGRAAIRAVVRAARRCREIRPHPIPIPTTVPSC